MGEPYSTIFMGVNVLTGLLGAAYQMLSGGGEVKIPTFPIYKIPTEDLTMLKDQISKNVAISDTARQAAVAALENYNQGRLSPSYEALYNEYAKEATRRTMQELAARGFTEGSSEYNRAMNQLGQTLAAYRAKLLSTQLDDALRVSGLADTTIKDLYNKWTAEAAVTGQQAQAMGLQYQTELRGKEYELERGRSIGQASERATKTLSDILKGTEPKTLKETWKETSYVTPSIGEVLKTPELPEIY